MGGENNTFPRIPSGRGDLTELGATSLNTVVLVVLVVVLVVVVVVVNHCYYQY